MIKTTTEQVFGWWITINTAATLTWWWCVCCTGTSGSDTAVLLDFFQTLSLSLLATPTILLHLLDIKDIYNQRQWALVSNPPAFHQCPQEAGGWTFLVGGLFSVPVRCLNTEVFKNSSTTVVSDQIIPAQHTQTHTPCYCHYSTENDPPSK